MKVILKSGWAHLHEQYTCHWWLLPCMTDRQNTLPVACGSSLRRSFEDKKGFTVAFPPPSCSCSEIAFPHIFRASHPPLKQEWRVGGNIAECKNKCHQQGKQFQKVLTQMNNANLHHVYEGGKHSVLIICKEWLSLFVNNSPFVLDTNLIMPHLIKNFLVFFKFNFVNKVMFIRGKPISCLKLTFFIPSHLYQIFICLCHFLSFFFFYLIFNTRLHF